jgi:PEP-CTERM motif
MKRIKPWVAGVGLCVAAASALAIPTLTFEGADDFDGDTPANNLARFYSADGISFEGAGALRDSAFVDGVHFDKLPEQMTNPPDDGTIMVFSKAQSDRAVPVATLISATGFNKFSFEYAASTQFSVEAWAAGGTTPLVPRFTFHGNQLDNCREQVSFCNWSIAHGSWTASATELRFYTFAQIQQVNIDNLALTASIPEPSTYALMVLGLVGMGLYSRRRRQD